MSTAPHLHVAQPRTTGPTAPEMPSTPGFVDALGERFLEFDLPTATAVERLHLRRDFGASPAFESALRDQIDRFEYFRHPAIAIARGVTRLPSGTLVLESRHVAGRRLSEIGLTRNTTLALDVIRQVTPALVALHEAGDVVHSLVGPERIVVTRENRLVLTEHVLGSAIAAARIPALQLREEFGLALPPSPEAINVDHADDLTELGLLVLSLLVGRRILPAEYPDRIGQLVGESAMTAADLSPEAAWMRRWIERAVRVGPQPFRSAREAAENIGEMSDTGALRATTVARPAPPVADPIGTPEPVVKTIPRPAPKVAAPEPPAAMWPAFVETTPIAVATAPTSVAPPPLPAPARSAPSASESSARSVALKVSMPNHSGSRRWMMLVLAIVAVGEAAVIAGLLVVRPPTIAALQASAPPPAPAVSPMPVMPPPVLDPKPPVPESTTAAPAADAASHTATPATTDAASAERFGGVRVTSPFDLQVFEGGKLVGVSAGPVALLAGPHTLDVANDALEFKAKLTALVRPGQLTPLSVTAPVVKINVNAVPWADVEIDGKAVGQTPLANLSVAVGQHEIVFRHPQLGELRQTATVKAVTPTRISVTYPK